MMLHVNASRLRQDLESLAEIGQRPHEPGLFRLAFSVEEQRAKRWLIEQGNRAGLSHAVDGADNVSIRYGRRPGIPAVATGSHLDTVPGGGPFDGALGVVAGLECLRCLAEEGVTLSHPIECIAFSDEEGRFGSLLGSRAMAGLLTEEELQYTRDPRGVTIDEALQPLGIARQRLLEARRAAGSLHAFVELHIEQGPTLESAGIPLGVVEAVAGLFKWRVTFTGVASHAGTTPMGFRRDALRGVAAFSLAIDRVLEAAGTSESRATIGNVRLEPGAANVVPGKAVFAFESRDSDPAVLTRLGEAFRQLVADTGDAVGLEHAIDEVSRVDPVPCAPLIQRTVERVATELGVPFLHLPSGAAHDTQIMATLAPAGLIFVPSLNGYSHSPREHTDWADIEIGANVLLNTLVYLAEQTR